MFSGTGFDPKRDIAGIILNRWGHAYCSPQVGFFFGKNGQPAPREVMRRAPFGRIAFANTDLSGDPGHTTAIFEGQRAASQLLDRIAPASALFRRPYNTGAHCHALPYRLSLHICLILRSNASRLYTRDQTAIYPDH
jgi:hypothetical protein